MSQPWWKRTTVYQIYPRSFADSNADGIGDLRGIIGRLDYLKWLGVETLWISPFYTSPQADFGYDISGHFDIAPEYGTLDDLDRLVAEVHRHDMKIVFDMVLNHTSDHHPWFLESRKSRDSAYRHFYIWRDGRKPHGAAPPNNWKSMLGGSGWRYDEGTEQWYWATFLPFQPDLNWRDAEVRAAMLDVVRHWLRRGADGLRLDLFNALYKDPSFADNPRSLRPFPSESNCDGFFQRNVNTLNHPDTIAFAKDLRRVVDEFHAPERFVVGEVFGTAELLRRYCGEHGDGLNLVFLFKSLTTRFTATAFRELIRDTERSFGDPLYPTWVFGNHDRPRILTRLRDEPERGKLLAALQLTVRGVPFVYYGEELGMPHPTLPRHEAMDPIAAIYSHVPNWLRPLLRKHGILLNRDEARSPMPWDDTEHGGFTAPHVDKTWLASHPHARSVNVAAQIGEESSVLRAYHRMLALRRTSRALACGSLELLDGDEPNHVLAYLRADGRERAAVYLNFSGKPRTIRVAEPDHATVHSNQRDASQPARSTWTLSAWEAIVVIDRAAPTRP